MSFSWNGMLFLHGHIADPELARRLATPSIVPTLPEPARRKRRALLPALARVLSYMRDAMRRSRNAQAATLRVDPTDPRSPAG
jgi:hypothetical protein